MTAILSADERILLWLNGLAGHVPLIDRFMTVMGDDWFILTFLALSMIALSVALYLLIAAVPAYITGDSRCMFVRCTIEVGR